MSVEGAQAYAKKFPSWVLNPVRKLAPLLSGTVKTRTATGRGSPVLLVNPPTGVSLLARDVRHVLLESQLCIEPSLHVTKTGKTLRVTRALRCL